MSYLALARKWRPKNFSELVGQDHVQRALTNALSSGRLHHAFLFTGTRGVGKTTIARILAKCLNCETAITATPCGKCSACTDIEAGRFFDLIEVDAASRTKVDDTRELLENVQYAPARGRYKVYLIDEVHMLSAHSFNALLKTLEEPPPHVKFLLATTDPQKLPVTVLSRCLQFNLKRLSASQISEQFKRILSEEKLAADDAALQLLALAADGSMRDGLSLLDQLIAFGAGQVTEDNARSMLGSVARDHIEQLARRLAAGDLAELLHYAQSLAQWAPDYAQLLDELARLFAGVALKQAVPQYENAELYTMQLLQELSAAIAVEDVQLFYQTAIIGRRDLALAPEPHIGFEMTLIRMLAFRPAAIQVAQPAPVIKKNTSSTAGSKDSWEGIVRSLELQAAAQQLAQHCAWRGKQGAVIKLALESRNQLFRTRQLEDKLAQALARYFNESIKLEFEIIESMNLETPAQAAREKSRGEWQEAQRTLDADPGARALKERFGATLVPESVRPLKS
jgi:DNA polymerase III subunit gamma/tau